MPRAPRQQENSAVSLPGSAGSEAIGAIPDDAAALADALRDDLSRLWTEHHAFLKGMARQWLHAQQADIDDVINDVMLRAGTVLALGEQIVTSERAWLVRLLYNRCVDVYRRRKTFEHYVKLSQTDPAAELRDENGGGVRSGEHQVLRRELTAVLMGAIQKLPAGLRGPVIMRLIEDAPYGVIARTYGLTPVNVRKRVQQGRALLRQTLAAYLRTGRTGGLESASGPSANGLIAKLEGGRRPARLVPVAARLSDHDAGNV